MLRRNRLKWFGQVTRTDVGNLASACRHVEVEGKQQQRRLRKSGPN